MGFSGPASTQSTLSQKAQKLLRAAARAQPLTVAAVPATVTVGTANAASTINAAFGTGVAASSTSTSGGQQFYWNDPRLTDVGAVWALDPDSPGNGYFGTNISNKASGGRKNGVAGAGKMFGFDGQTFEVCTFNGPLRVAATDLTTGLRQWYMAADQAIPASTQYTKIDFGSRAPRIVEVFFAGTSTRSSCWGRSMVFPATDTVWVASRIDEAKIAVFGDSYPEGQNNDSIKTRYSDILGERFGCIPVVNGVSGSGYLAAINGFTWRGRIANGDMDVSRIGSMDLVFQFGSINDNASSDASVQAEVTLEVQALMAAQPNAIIMVAGPQFTAATQTSVARYGILQAGVVAAAAGDPRVVYIDNSPAGEAWQWGTGKSGTLTGIGNNDLYLAADGAHWTAAGNKYGGNRIADSIIAKLRALA